jgi:hypothetical protein
VLRRKGSVLLRSLSLSLLQCNFRDAFVISKLCSTIMGSALRSLQDKGEPLNEQMARDVVFRRQIDCYDGACSSIPLGDASFGKARAPWEPC